MIIRQLLKSDYKEYLELIREFRPITINVSEHTFNEIYDSIFKNNIIFVAIKDGKLVGSITCLVEQKFIHNLSKYIHIEDFIVSSNYRGMGIGNKLLDFIKKYSSVIKAYKIILNCDEDLLKFYEKNNFKCNGEKKMEYKL